MMSRRLVLRERGALFEAVRLRPHRAHRDRRPPARGMSKKSRSARSPPQPPSLRRSRPRQSPASGRSASANAEAPPSRWRSSSPGPTCAIACSLALPLAPRRGRRRPYHHAPLRTLAKPSLPHPLAPQSATMPRAFNQLAPQSATMPRAFNQLAPQPQPRPARLTNSRRVRWVLAYTHSKRATGARRRRRHFRRWGRR